MKLYIQIRDGKPYEHPILESNFKEAFPDVDTENLPSNFAKFERVTLDWLGVYQVHEGVSYEWVDGIVKDVHKVRDMTLAEKTAKQDSVKNWWAENGRYPSWVFDELNCRYVAPVPMPTDGKNYAWDEATISWKERT
jgi:hypothetical protein